MKVELITFKRIMCILSRLRIGPASKKELLHRVNERVGYAYGSTDERKSISRFEHDIARLRDIGVVIQYKEREYHLINAEAIDTL